MCRWFDSAPGHHRMVVAYGHDEVGLVAQSVEQRIENPCVGGSIPPRATNIQIPRHAGQKSLESKHSRLFRFRGTKAINACYFRLGVLKGA